MRYLQLIIFAVILCLLTGAKAQKEKTIPQLKSEVAKFFEEKNYEAAEQHLKLIIKKDRKSELLSAYYSDLGTTQRRLKKNRKALKSYNKAIRIRNNEALYYTNRATLKSEMGNIKGALKDYEKALEVKEHFLIAYINRAQLYEKQGNIDGAIKDLETLLKYEKSVGAASNLAILRKKKGNFQAALDDFNTLIEENPLEAYLYNNRADTKMVMGFLDDALWDIQRAIDLNELYPVSFVTKGEILTKQGKTKEACEAFRQAIALGFTLDKQSALYDLIQSCK